MIMQNEPGELNYGDNPLDVRESDQHRDEYVHAFVDKWEVYNWFRVSDRGSVTPPASRRGSTCRQMPFSRTWASDIKRVPSPSGSRSG